MEPQSSGRGRPEVPDWGSWDRGPLLHGRGVRWGGERGLSAEVTVQLRFERCVEEGRRRAQQQGGGMGAASPAAAGTLVEVDRAGSHRRVLNDWMYCVNSDCL